MPEAVRYETKGQVAILTIDDPANRNALSRPVREGLWAGLRRADADPQVQAIVLTGAGERAFCAGADLREFAAEATGLPPEDYVPIPGRNLRLDTVLIAAVNGAALGGGFLLAQTADLVVAAEHAVFGMPEAKVGRGAPWSVPLSQMVPQRVWMQLCLTGEPISAQRAYQIGLINAVVPGPQVLPEALSLAQRVTANAPLTVAASRQMIGFAAEMGRSAAWDVADLLFAPVYQSEDALEGPRAFQERRPPRWQGR